MAQDDELALQMVGDVNGATPTGPSIADWSPEVALLSDLVDVVLMLRSEIWSLARQKPPPYRPTPRPKTAADRAQQMRRQQQREDLRRTLFPGQ